MFVFDPSQTLDEQIDDPNSFVLLDEADYMLLDHASKLSNQYVYAVSATGVKTTDRKAALEAGFLDHCKFERLDSMLQNDIKLNEVYPSNIEQFM